MNAQKLPCGVRFFHCALQVNPFEYIVRHNKETAFSRRFGQPMMRIWEVILTENNIKEAEGLPSYVLEGIILNPVNNIDKVIEIALKG